MNKTTIYGLVDPLTNQLRYIGKTIQDPYFRYASHISISKHNKKKDHTHCWIKSLLNNKLKPEIVIIQENTSIEDEIFYIEYYKSIGCNLTNHTKGGDTGTSGHTWKLSKETKKRLVGRGGKSLDQYDLNGNFIKTWKSQKEYSNFYNLNSNAANNSMKNNSLCAGHYIVRFGKLPVFKTRILNNPIFCFDNITKIETEYKNTIVAAKELNLDNSGISKCIKTGLSYFNRYSFKNKY